MEHSHNSNTPEHIQALQKEIALLTQELKKVQKQLAPLENEVHNRLHKEIERVQELTNIYKKQQEQTKTEQPEQEQNNPQPNDKKASKKATFILNEEEKKVLKRIYKEAIRQVHPDKLIQTGCQDAEKTATKLTAELNRIYKHEDLEELIKFYERVIASTFIGGTSAKVDIDPELRRGFLEKKKQVIASGIKELKSSYLYTVMATYKNPLSFVDELRKHFTRKIEVLEKRTGGK
ncbi:hypothetical protein RCC89_02930 [Cytophagaceae bacterium ABcell3]|nr:hypothetical protein RCC89_02930 [Cytophagaceae bacterium ABcell3]